MTVEIRRVSSQGQIEAVAELAREIWSEHYTPIIGPDQVQYMIEKFQSPAVVRNQIAEGYEYYTASGSAGAVGYFAVQPRAGGRLFLSKVYVAAAERGRGIGRTCFEFIVARARALGLKSILLTVNKNNSATIKAYERWGFVRTRALVADIGGGFVMDDWEYVYTLEEGG